ncbi:MAG: LamG-like jellyroll fold domain-containing protein, partial [Eubacteriales bacterium]
MKKALKSVMASALAVAMMIIASVACVASPYTADGIADSMIVKWDFNGEGEAALSDKATADGVSSNLTAVGDVVMNGSTAKVSEVNSSSLKTEAFEGFNDLVSTTIYMKVRITAQASNYECMFYVSNKLRIMTNNSAKFNVRATAGHNPNLTALTFPVNENYEWNNGDWIYVALAFNGNAVDPQTTLYASADGINYSYVSTDKAGSATTVSKMLGSTSVSVILGQYNADEPKATFEYDEVRIYNRALSEQEVKSISAQSVQPVFAGVQNTVADSE